MRNVLRHNECLTCVEDEHLAADSEAAGALEHGHHSVAARRMGGYLLALVEGENRHADEAVLHQRLADDLPLLILNQILEMYLLLRATM